MTNTNVFFQALSQGLRFETKQGRLTTEDLFHLSQRQLNELFIQLNQARTQLSFGLETNSDNSEKKQSDKLLLQLALVEAVFNHKKQEQESKQEELVKAQKRKQLLDALERKQGAELESLSAEEIKQQLASL